jgi:hypothetical protein
MNATAKATDCQGINRVTGKSCDSKAVKHIVEPGTLRMRHFCAPHAWRYFKQLNTSAWARNFNAKLDATARAKA